MGTNRIDQVLGSVRTQASDNLVTDSAASATAFGCGVKTYNAGMFSFDIEMFLANIWDSNRR